MLLPLLGACSLLSGGPRPMTDGDGFFDRPWPDEGRMVEGHPDMTGFPGADEYELVARYAEEASQLDGFGTAAPIYQRFRDPVELDALPSAAESMSPDAAMFLVDIDPDSPDRGLLTPITWDYQDTETGWQPADLLAVQPVWGRPLRPRTRYAMVYTTDMARPVPGFSDVWDPADDQHETWRDLQEVLFGLSIDTQRVSWAVQFRTQDITSEVAAIAARIHGGLPTPALDQRLQKSIHSPYFTAWHGQLSVPCWQHGESPYLVEGGGFEFDEDGWPLLDHWDRVEFTLSLPPEPPPEAGWPVVIYAHGTGGDNDTFADQTDGLEVASMLAKVGLAGLSISLPFHGDRNPGGDPGLLSFNYSNPTAGRTNFRQAALEQVYLAELLSSQVHTFTLDDGEQAWTDPDRVAYLGHSHGGEIGAPAVPFFGDTVRGVVLSGTGGGLSLSVVYREADEFDIGTLLQQTFGFSDEEELDETHPLVGMVQLIGEVTDPLNYAPYWHRWDNDWGSPPANVLMFEGLSDIYTPPVSIEALAGAADHPLLEPVEQTSLVQELVGPDPQPTPAQDNLVAWDDSAVTGGLAQYADQGHFAIFDDKDAAKLYQAFLATAMDGSPTINAR